MQIHLLSGFLGSGKTTAIQSAVRLLAEKGIKTGVITNDQGIRLVDAGFFKHLGIPGRQVMNGCFCCNYQDLDTQIRSLMETEKPDLIFAESVGSCTDIVATVLKPLMQFRPQSRVTLSVFADALLLHMLLIQGMRLFEESVQYIYDKQLEEASILILNKVDLLNEGQLQELRKKMQEKYADKILHEQHETDKHSVDQWLVLLDKASAVVPASLDIDYAVYGEGEARLAWLDQEIEIESAEGQADKAAASLMRDIHQKISAGAYPIGHLKFLVNGKQKISFTFAAAAGPESDTGQSFSATLLLNARVQTEPGILSELITESIRRVEQESGAHIRTRSLSAFQPGFPTPAHRMA